MSVRAPTEPIRGVSDYALESFFDPSRRDPFARRGRAMQAAFYEIMFAPGALTRAEREMLAAVASAAQDCEY